MKKLVRYLALALLVVWAVQDPNGAAALAQALIGWFAHAAALPVQAHQPHPLGAPL